MAPNEVTSDIASLESRAEKVLAEARATASDVLRSASKEATRIVSEPLALDRARAECAAIVEAARERSRVSVKESAQEADRLRARVKGGGAKAFQAIVQKIERMVRGAR
jgi:vacuolar-type H+-ATPase subunit H